MKYYAKVISLDEDIEELVVLSLGEKEICCFIDHCEHPINEGGIYLVDMDLTFLDDELIELSDSNVYSLKRKGNGFSYFINGFLIDDTIYVDGIAFKSDSFSESSYLSNSYIRVDPDRISVSFL
ncbi:hypothetical protein [Serratia fonticola]|uniref:hypothetical protein n=1 Tax=Serratia fonticola TaxID=47917 RepID=UPI0034C6D1F8